MKRPLRIGSTSPVWAVGVALVVLMTAGCHDSADTPHRTPIQVVKKPIVTVARPLHQDMSNVVEIPAEVEAWQAAKLYAKVAGYLLTLDVDKGDHVVKGQLLATIDSPETAQAAEAAQQAFHASQAVMGENQAELAKAQAEVEQMASEIDGARAHVNEARAMVDREQGDLALSQATYHRIKTVYDKDHGLIAREDVDVAEAGVNDSQAKLLSARESIVAASQEVLEAQSRKTAAERQVLAVRAQASQDEFQSKASQEAAHRARTLLSYTQLRAPFTGDITARYLDPGALVQDSATNAQGAAQPVVSEADYRTVRVYVQVPETDLPLVHRGTLTTLLVDELPGKVFKGTVTRMSGQLSSDTRTMLTEIDLPNPRRLLHPGMLARMDLSLGNHPNALTVPLTALAGEGDHPHVYVVKDNVAHRVNVETSYQTPTLVQITQGLNGNDEVVVQGKDNLQEGTEVEVQRAASE